MDYLYLSEHIMLETDRGWVRTGRDRRLGWLHVSCDEAVAEFLCDAAWLAALLTSDLTRSMNITGPAGAVLQLTPRDGATRLTVWSKQTRCVASLDHAQTAIIREFAAAMLSGCLPAAPPVRMPG